MYKNIRTFYGFVVQKKLVFLVFLILLVLEYVLFALNPYFYKLFVDAIPSVNEPVLLDILTAFIAVRVCAVVIDLIVGWLGDYIIFAAATNARIKIFKKVQDLDFAFHTEKSTGSLISAFKRGDGAFFSLFHDIHYRIISVVINFFVMFYFFATLNWSIVILTTGSLIATILVIKYLISNNVAKRKVFNLQEDEVSGIITDNLLSFETVKLFAKESWEENRLRTSFIPWMKALWGYGNSFRVIDGTMGTIINISIFLVLFLSIRQSVNLQLNVGEFVLVTGFISNFFPKLWDLVWGSRDLAKNYADIEKYFDLLEHDIQVKDPIKPLAVKKIDGVIEFKNVSHSYPGGTKNAVKNFNLKINQGESVAIIGKSGSGKTTITKLLMRFFDPVKGRITIDGIDIRKLNKSDLRGIFGVVPQEPILFNNTVGYNIAYGTEGKASLRKIKDIARLANIDKFIEKLPKKYETNVGERGIKLSGGQKQRLAIARMIMSNPDIIIFDEATSHLDSESEKLIQESFWKEAKGKTTIIIAHRLSTIAMADRIVVMEKGEIKEIGTHKDLLENPESLYSHFWNLQIKME